jgi:DNA invertase Pin-like site-specific DNA recombinase
MRKDIPGRRHQEVNGTGPELIRLLEQLRKGDVLVVWRLDPLSRSLRDVLMIMERIQKAEAGFRSLMESLDTTTAPGRMMMQMVGAFAEFERAILRERTKAGLDAARKAGLHRIASSKA